MKVKCLNAIVLVIVVVAAIELANDKVGAPLTENDFIPSIKLLTIKGLVVNVRGLVLLSMAYSCPYSK